MKRIILLKAFVLSITLIFGQNMRVFDGQIGNYPIKMFLNFNNSEVKGYYFYKKYGRPIFVSGEFSAKQMILSESDDIIGTGESKIDGQFILNENYNGKWKTLDKELNVNLHELAYQIKWENFKQKVELTHTFGNNIKNTFPIQVSIVVPDFKENQELMNLILPEIMEVERDDYSSIWGYFNKYVIQNFSKYLNDDFSDEYTPYFEINMQGIVMSITDSVLNYMTSGSVYQGGTHGYGFENYYIFDLKRMRRLKYDDLFKPDAKPIIAKLLYEKDSQQHKIENFENGLGNIYLTDKGVGFFFNRYQLDCYACGTFNYFLEFSELKSVLKEQR